jgi:hypothetical protein
VPLSLYLHFITVEKIIEYRPHLIVGFYPILGFPGYILCSFCEWCVLLFSLFFLHFSYFINLSIKLVIINMRYEENKPQ